MTKYNKDFGLLGEQIALDLFQKRGFTILDNNIYFKAGQLDLIVEKNETIHFVEVKTRSSEDYLPLIESISKKQLKTLVLSAERYLEKNEIVDKNWQIDLLGLILHKTTVQKVEYIPNIDL